MKFGFNLFDIHYTTPADLEYMEKEIANLMDVWKIKEDWDNKWELNKTIRFIDFNSEDLDDMADEFLKKVNKYPKEMKKWEIVNFLKGEIEKFKSTLPLISMLREPCMRDRHWIKL